MTYLKGEIVRIVIPEAHVIEVRGDDEADQSLCIQLVDGQGAYHVEIPIGDPVVVVRVVPAGGMPRPGDIWRDVHGAEYFVKQEGPQTARTPRLVHAGYSSNLWESVETVNRESGPLTLVYRPNADPIAPS